MAKRKREIQQTDTEYRASEQLDDHILPTAEELIRYKEVDPSIIEFLKERAKQEQNQRHKYNEEILIINKREQRLHHGLNYTALLFGFVIIMSAMYLSYLLISLGHVVSGSIFGGIGIFYVGYLFTSVVKRSNESSNKD